MPFSFLTDRVPSAVGRLVSELLIVVIGVLIALWANDLWSNRHDRVEELQILDAVQEDVRATIELVDVTIERVERDILNLQVLSQGSAGSAAHITPGELAQLLNSLWDLPPVSVQMSAYEEIQDSGRVRLIGDPELRQMLAHYRQTYEYLVLAHQDAFLNQHVKLDPYLLAHLQLAQLSRAALARDAGDAPLQIEPLTPVQDHRALLNDSLFQSHVAMKFFLLSYYIAQARQLRDLLNELDLEIDRRSVTLRGVRG